MAGQHTTVFAPPPHRCLRRGPATAVQRTAGATFPLATVPGLQTDETISGGLHPSGRKSHAFRPRCTENRRYQWLNRRCADLSPDGFPPLARYRRAGTGSA